MKIKLENVIIPIVAIIFTICLTIMILYQIPLVCELYISNFGLNIGSIITVIDGYICISLIVVCIIATIQLIKCIFF